MNREKLTEEQVLALVKQAELGAKVADLCRRTCEPDPAVDDDRTELGRRLVRDLHRLRQLEEENARLRKQVAELCRDNLAMQDVLSKGL